MKRMMKTMVTMAVVFAAALCGVAAETSAAEAPTLNRTGWNAKVKQQFMHPPVFTYEPVTGAVKYVCVVGWKEGNEAKSATLESATPELNLAGVWAAMPAAGAFVAKVSAVDAQGKVLATARNSFKRKADFKGPYRPAKCGYDESGEKAAAWLLKANCQGSLPVLFCSSYIRLLTTYVRLNPKGEMAAAALERAKQYGQTLLKGSTPTNWVYANVPQSHNIKPPMFQVGRGGMAGLAYLDLYGVTQDKTWFDAAVRIADTLKKNQLPDGHWPFRVESETGKVVWDYTADQAEQIILLDELIVKHGRKEYVEARDRAVAWMLDDPCKTFQWQNQWDDLGAFHVPPPGKSFGGPPYQNLYRNLDHYATGLFIEYLLRYATPQNGYEATAKDLARYIEDQFVEWEPVGKEIKPGVYEITPGVREQYAYYWIIDWHGAHYIRVCMAFHAKTGEEIWLKKARSLADTLTAVQHPDGFYPTFLQHKPTKESPTDLKDIYYGGLWPNCTSYSGEMLLRLGEYVKTERPQKD